MAASAGKQAKRSKKKTAAVGALMHGTAAYGARYLKKGFGFTAEDDLAWALGYPHLRVLTDEPDEYFARWKLGYPLSEEYAARIRTRTNACCLLSTRTSTPRCPGVTSRACFCSWRSGRS